MREIVVALDCSLGASEGSAAIEPINTRLRVWFPDDAHVLMAEHAVACSFSRSGNVWDNAVMESFFSSLKVERVAAKIYRTRDEARTDVFDYIEAAAHRASRAFRAS
jgi:transposase InsO family protein